MASLVRDLTRATPIKAALLAALVTLCASSGARASPLADPVALNIGLSCQWQQRCMSQQKKAMKRALKYVKNEQPPTWRIELCNRNASRKSRRVDWIGFNNCVRNAVFRPPAQRTVKQAPRRVIQTSAPARARGERG